jgi:hypothetical protein
MIQANYSDSLGTPPSLPAEALEEFTELTYVFLSKYLEEYEIPSVEVIIQWNPKKETDAIAQPSVMSTTGCVARSGRRCLNSNNRWGTI